MLDLTWVFFLLQGKASGENGNENVKSDHGVCAICLNQIVLQETALVKGCEHAYWFVSPPFNFCFCGYICMFIGVCHYLLGYMFAYWFVFFDVKMCLSNLLGKRV